MGDSDGMDTTWELFTDAELVAEARNAQSRADTLPHVLAEPLHSLAGQLLTELAYRQIAHRESRWAS